MRTDDVIAFIRSRYPEEVTTSDIAEELSDIEGYIDRVREVIYARRIALKLCKYGYVTKRTEGNRAFYLWIPEYEEASV